MNLPDLKLILSRLGVPENHLNPTQPNQLLIPCPLAKWTHTKGYDKNPSTSIRFGDPSSPTLWQCFTCKEKGKLWYLVQSFGHFAQDQEIIDLGLRLTVSDEPTMLSRLEHIASDFDSFVYEQPTREASHMNPEILERFPKVSEINLPVVVDYLKKRRVTKDMADFWNLRYHSQSGRLLFPVFDQNNNFVGAVGRALQGQHPKYYNFFGFQTGQMLGGINKATGQKKWGVVEGFHDLMNVWYWGQKHGYDIVCSFKSVLSDMNIEMLTEQDKSVHGMFDQDKAGNEGWLKAERALSTNYGTRRIQWSPEDIDMGDFTTEEQFVSAINHST